jgi:hypothetical protein
VTPSRRFLALLASVSVPLLACGGRLLEDEDATAPDASDASAEGPYTGEWCNPETGPADGPGGGAVFCTKNPYSDAPEYCHRVYSSPVLWDCCTADNPLCCPLAAHMEDYGEITQCCASLTDCSRCCDGIDPKP